MKPLKQNPIIFNNTSHCIVNGNLLAKAILWYQIEPTFSNKKIYMYGKYPAVSIGKKKIHVHRLLIMYWHRKILKSSEYVHHKNGNRLDCTIGNLEIMDAKKHQILHNKGKTISDEHKKAISEANRKRKGMKYKIHENPELR